MSARIIVGDCRVSMAEMETASVDSIVCDPPYELGFMGKSWDASGIAYDLEVWRQALRVLKPGGYLLAYSATRTYHRMTCAIEDAGFEIRDCIGWHYGSGFPKSLSVEKNVPQEHAAAWKGWGTALKPAWEPVVVARKPLEGTVAANVLKYGTGALNIDGCRVPTSDRLGGGHSSSGQQMSDGWRRPWMDDPEAVEANAARSRAAVEKAEALGRWPANIILSHDPACGEECAPGCPCAAMDAQSGVRKSGRLVIDPGKGIGAASENVYQGGWRDARIEDRPASEGGASRFFNQLPIEADDLVPFFYAGKASRREREAGCDDLPARSGAEAVEREEGSAGVNSPRAGAGRTAASVRNNHPTVKPVSVMAWCIRLVTPPGGLVLDPFTGSGTTGVAARREGMRFVGCELSEEYAKIARARIAHASGPLFSGGE